MPEYNDKKRYIRWQDYRIKQFSFIIHLFLTFGVALLGALGGLLISSKFVPKGISKFYFLLSFYSISASVVLGALASISRLIDFRITCIKIREHKEFEKNALFMFLNKHIGSISWGLFWTQILTIFLGSIMLALSLLNTFNTKIN